MAARLLLGLAIVSLWLPLVSAHAQSERKPTAREIAAIRTCAAKYQDDVDEGERQCLFKLVATPCITPEGASTQGQSFCYHLERMIWDDLLNENFKNLLDVLDDQQAEKLRAMQHAWIAYRDTTCNFYMDKIQGTMAIPMGAACAARETARRALLLRFFDQM